MKFNSRKHTYNYIVYYSACIHAIHRWKRSFNIHIKQTLFRFSFHSLTKVCCYSQFFFVNHTIFLILYFLFLFLLILLYFTFFTIDYLFSIPEMVFFPSFDYIFQCGIIHILYRNLFSSKARLGLFSKLTFISYALCYFGR